MARAINYRFNFWVGGLGQLANARNVLSSFGGRSWGAFNEASRGASMAERSFSSLGSTLGKLGAGLGAGMLTKGLIMSNAELQNNRIIFEEMVGKGAKANEMIGMLRDNAAEFGIAEGEVFKSARGLYSGFSAGGRIVSTKNMSDLMQMAELLNAVDTENRGISFSAFSLKEIAQGQGKGDFKSMTNRLEIPIRDAYKHAIVTALQSGNVDKAIDTLWLGLKDAKIERSTMTRLMQESFMLNLNAIKAYVTRFFQTLGMPMFNEIAEGLFMLKKALKPLMTAGSPFMESLLAAGERAKARVIPVLKSIAHHIGSWVFSQQGFMVYYRLMEALDTGKSIVKQLTVNWITFAAALGLGDFDRQQGLLNLLNGTLRDMLAIAKELQPIMLLYGKAMQIIMDVAIDHPRLFEFYLVLKLISGGSILSGINKLSIAMTGLGAATTVAGAGGAGGAAAGGLLGFLQRLSMPVVAAGAGSAYGAAFSAIGAALLASSVIWCAAALGWGLLIGTAIKMGIIDNLPGDVVNKWIQDQFTKLAAWWGNFNIAKNAPTDAMVSARMKQLKGQELSKEDQRQLEIAKKVDGVSPGFRESLDSAVATVSAKSNNPTDRAIGYNTNGITSAQFTGITMAMQGGLASAKELVGNKLPTSSAAVSSLPGFSQNPLGLGQQGPTVSNSKVEAPINVYLTQTITAGSPEGAMAKAAAGVVGTIKESGLGFALSKMLQK